MFLKMLISIDGEIITEVMQLMLSSTVIKDTKWSTLSCRKILKKEINKRNVNF